LFLRREKCHFGKSKVCYLGHIISQHGIALDLEKIIAILDWPHPITLKALKGFLGLTVYYRKFIRGYGVIAKPLTDLLKKDTFEWFPTVDEAFFGIKTGYDTSTGLGVA
jgi:hypothetical protein